MFEKFIKPTKNFFWPKQINTCLCLMILNEKPNYAASRILMSPRPIDLKENAHVAYDIE
jgi:hypothetical protein